MESPPTSARQHQAPRLRPAPQRRRLRAAAQLHAGAPAGADVAARAHAASAYADNGENIKTRCGGRRCTNAPVRHTHAHRPLSTLSKATKCGLPHLGAARPISLSRRASAPSLPRADRAVIGQLGERYQSLKHRTLTKAAHRVRKPSARCFWTAWLLSRHAKFHPRTRCAAPAATSAVRPPARIASFWNSRRGGQQRDNSGSRQLFN